MMKNDKPCSLCGILDREVQFYIPPAPIALVYKQLMSIGQHYKAAMFLAINKGSFNCYCVKCWVYDFVLGAMLDETTTDAEKTQVINEHFDITLADTDPELLWKRIGNPELN